MNICTQKKAFGFRTCLIFLFILGYSSIAAASPDEQLKVNTRRLTRSAGLSTEYFQEIVEPRFSKRWISAYRKARDKWLDEHDLERIETAPDGSCIFDALISQLEQPVTGAEHTAAGLREFFLIQLRGAYRKASFHNTGAIEHHEDSRWLAFFRMFPSDIADTIEELKNVRVWGRGQTMASLAGFLLKQPVIHFFISREKSKYSIQGFDETGTMVECWESLLSRQPLYLMHNGDGHYEGAKSCFSVSETTETTDIEMEPVPEPDSTSDARGDRQIAPDERKIPLDITDKQVSSSTNTVTSPYRPVYSPITPADSPTHNDSTISGDIDEFPEGLVLSEWLDGTNQRHLNYAEVVQFVAAYDPGLKVGSYGIQQFQGGFFGALISAFFRLRIPTLRSDCAAEERLHDLVFMQETLNLLERLATEPVLAPEAGKALTFLGKGTSDFPAQVILDVMEQLYHLTDRIWEQEAALVVLASCYNQPLMLLHPSARNGYALLVRPWHRPLLITSGFVQTAIKSFYPAVLVHNGGLGQYARWRAVIHDCHPAPIHFHPHAETTEDIYQAPWLAPLLTAVIQRRLDNALNMFHLETVQKNLASCHRQYLPFCHLNTSTMSGDAKQQAIAEINEQTLQPAGTPRSMQVGLTLQKVRILQNLQQFDEAFQLLDELLDQQLPLYLKWRVLLEPVNQSTHSRQDLLCRSLKHLNDYPRLVKRSRKLTINKAVILEKLHDIDQSLVLLKNLQKHFRHDLEVTELRASLLGDRGRAAEGVKLLSKLPGYRHIGSVSRSLAKLYAAAGELERSLNLITPLVTYEPSTENINTLLAIVCTSDDPVFLSDSRKLFDYARRNVPGSARHIDHCHFGVEVTLGKYDQAIKMLRSSHSTEEVEQRIRQEARYRKKCGETETMARLCKAGLSHNPNDLELLKLYTRWLEENKRVNDAHLLYKRCRHLLQTDAAMTRNAMIFYEKHINKAPDFFDYEEIPQCPCCYLYLTYIEYQQQHGQESCQTVLSVYQQHLRKIFTIGCPHWLYQNPEQIGRVSDSDFREQRIFSVCDKTRNHLTPRQLSQDRRRDRRQFRKFDPVRPAHSHRTGRSDSRIRRETSRERSRRRYH